MDASYEDKMYRQIEKSLASNINEKIFVPIEMIDKPTYAERKSKYVQDAVSNREDVIREDFAKTNYSQNNDDSISNMDTSGYNEEATRMSRAEYIRQAREACLRQLNAIDTSVKTIDYSGGQEEINNPLFGRKKRDKVTKLFNEGREEDDTQDDLVAYRSLIIRTVCAIVIFLSIFIIDKIKLSWGNFSYETIKNYITSNNQLKVIEEIIVSWLK